MKTAYLQLAMQFQQVGIGIEDSVFNAKLTEATAFSPTGHGGHHPMPLLTICVRAEKNKSLWLVVSKQFSSGFYGQVRDCVPEEPKMFLQIDGEAPLGELRQGIIRDGFGEDARRFLSKYPATECLHSLPVNPSYLRLQACWRERLF